MGGLKDQGSQNQVPEETSPHLPLGAQDQLQGCEAGSTSLWVQRNLFWQLSREGNMHGSGMSHASTASPSLSFRAPWRVDDAVAGRGNAGWTTPTSGHPRPYKNCSQGPLAKNAGRESELNRLSCPLDDPIGQGTELN